MATKLRIPESHRPDLALLLSLDDLQLRALTKALDSVTVSTSSEFASKAGVPNIEEGDLAKMFNILRALYTVRAHDNIELEDFVGSLVEAIRTSGEPKLVAVSDNEEQTKDRLLKLLSAAAFSVSVKAQDLATEFERTAYGVRVFTDLRPVFRESVAEPLAGMMVMHTLKLEYHIHDHEHQFLYVTFPHDQLVALQGAIARALEKEKALASKLEDGGIPQLAK